MNWFQKLTGFQEANFFDTQNKLFVDGFRLHSKINGRNFGIGSLTLASLDDLRKQSAQLRTDGRLKVSIVKGDVGMMHSAPEFNGALFQVASQFNLLEMTGPSVSPEEGVTIYQNDHTQGPACAIAAGAATIYRNYFVPFKEGVGQTKTRQLNALAELADALCAEIGGGPTNLINMQNGYAFCTNAALSQISNHLGNLGEETRDSLRRKLKIGVHNDVEVTRSASPTPSHVTQAFCSALPVSYSRIAAPKWENFGRLILEAAYEATLHSAISNAKNSGSNIVLLTMLGGGAFGNDEVWIYDAMRRALALFKTASLDVRLVTYTSPSRTYLQLTDEFG